MAQSASTSKWPHLMTAWDGQWQLPHGDNEYLTTFGSPSARSTESVNGPKIHISHTKHSVPDLFSVCKNHTTLN